MPDWLLKKLAAKGGLIGFQIGNEFVSEPNTDSVGETADMAGLAARSTAGRSSAVFSHVLSRVGRVPDLPNDFI